METKDLICSINNFEANIVFDKNRSYREIANGQSPFFFTPVEKGERKRYEKSENKNEFTSTTAAIHIMDSSVEEIEKLFKLDDSGIYEYTCKMIRPYCKGVVDIKIGLVLFQFLHEVGHWNQFMSLDKNVAAYTTWNYEQEKNNYEKMRALKDSVLQRQAREKDNRLSAEERMLFRQYTEEYRNIPKEKEADEFALSYLKETIDKYREVCRNKNSNRTIKRRILAIGRKFG